MTADPQTGPVERRKTPPAGSRSIAASPGRHRSRLWLLGSFGLILLLMLASIDRWATQNDSFYDLSSGFNVGEDDPDIQRLYNAALEVCHRYASQKQLSSCLGNQEVLRQNLFLNYPIAAAFGRSLTSSAGTGSLLSTVTWSAAASSFAGLVLAGCLVVVILWHEDSVAQRLAAVSLPAIVLVQLLAFKPALKIVMPAFGERPWGIAALVGGLAALVALARSERAERLSSAAFAAFAGRKARLVATSLAVGALLVAARATGVFRVGAEILAFVAAIAFFAAALRSARLPPLVAALCALIVFASFNPSLRLLLEVPRTHGALLIAALLAVASWRPGSRTVWLMPAALLFHIGAAGLSAALIAIAEGIVCIRRGRLSPLFAASTVTAALGVGFFLGFYGGVQSAKGTDVRQVLALVAASPMLVPTLVALALTAAAAFLLLSAKDETWDGVARLAFLVIGLLAGLQISAAVDAAVTAMFAPGMMVVIQSAPHIATGISLGAILGICGIMAKRAAAAAELPGPTHLVVGGGGGAHAWAVPVVVVVCLALSLAPPGRASKFPGGVVNSVAILAAGQEPTKAAEIDPAAAYDDQYFLSASGRRHAPIAYFSRLKLLIRKTSGAFDPLAMRVFATDGVSTTEIPGVP
jgi:hypothetical protein